MRTALRRIPAIVACLLFAAGAVAAPPSIEHGTDIVEATAARELAAWWPWDTAAITSIQLGTPQTSDAVAVAHAAEPFQLTDNPESFHARADEGVLWIVGRGPKGVLNGVFRLMDARPGDVAAIDLHGSPAFRYRIGDHRRTQYPPPDWSDRDQARYYASHYVNVVWGEKFGPPLPYDVRREYGLGLMLEASLPPTPEGTHWGESGHASPWWDDPAHASAIYWWGRHSWYGKVKVVDPFDPVGRQAYLDHFGNLLERNPDTRVLYCIFGDYSWAPNPDSRRISDGRAYPHGEEETIFEILSLMKEAIGERDVVPAVWMWLLFPEQGKEAFMETLASRGIGVMYNEAGDNDCWTYVRDNFDHLALKQAAGPGSGSKFGPDFIPLVSVGGTCESVRPAVGLPLPAIGAGKLLRVREAGIDDFIIWWGSCEGWAYHANNEVLSELYWRPGAFDPNNPRPFDRVRGEPLLIRIAERDFGADLAPQVLRFWDDFEQALVDTDRRGDPSGMKVFSWYQRTGNYLVFLDAQAMPLTPDVLAQKDRISSLFPWAVNPEAIATFAQTAERLEAALTLLEPLLDQTAETEVHERLDSMHRNGLVYLYTLRMQLHHMQALRVMEDAHGVGHAAPGLKARLLPVIAREDANTRAMIDLLRTFPPNYYLGGSWKKGDMGRRGLEIGKLQTKLAKMRDYVQAGAEAIEPRSVVNSSQGMEIDLGTTRAVEAVTLRFADPDTDTMQVSVSDDGQTWRSIDTATPEAYGTAVVMLEGAAVRMLRVTPMEPAAASAALPTVALHPAPLIRELRVGQGALRPVFAPAVADYTLVLPPDASRVELEVDLSDAAQVTVSGARLTGGRGAIPVGDEPLAVHAEAGGRQVTYRIVPLRNLAFGAAASADSVNNGRGPALAVDGAPVTDADDSRWISRGGAGPKWLALDLGTARRIGRAMVRSGYRGGTSLAIEDFRLQVSDDGASWTDIPGAIVMGNRDTAVEMSFPAVTSRYVRLRVDKTPNGIARLYELELYPPIPGGASQSVDTSAEK